MHKRVLLLMALIACFAAGNGWGFYGHRMINRLAVFTLPQQLLGFYKKHIEFVTEHAPDADRRRYGDPEEACRHYIDLDVYEKCAPVDTVPKFWKDAVAKYSEDTLKAYGIVPWHIQVMKYRLTQAFKDKDVNRILRASADIGHYIADAHVPLHATQNYNGQMTNQHGIHAFWESRLPELFAGEYDFFVGRATYIDDVLAAAWQASESSFAAKDSVLNFERQLSKQFSPDNKYTYEQKGQTQVRAFSRAYSAAYHDMLPGQVERRMRASVWLVGSVWYTAWVDAGQPDLGEMTNESKPMTDDERKQLIEENKKLTEQKMIGRQED
jgi:hypothetical protein